MVKKEESGLEENPAPLMVTEPKKKKVSVWWFVLAAILIIALFAVKGNYDEINDYLNPSAPEIIRTPADVQLMMFSPLSGNRSTNVELWLMNLGQNTSTNISVFVRVRTENGSVIFDDEIVLSAMILRENETCTGDYTVLYPLGIESMRHTIEVVWSDGRHVYSKTS